MDKLLFALKDHAAIVVACVAASVSIVNLVWSTYLNEGRDRRKVLWERELDRFAEIEDAAGYLVEDAISHTPWIDEHGAVTIERHQALRTAIGRFIRYPAIASALRDITQSTAWCISQRMKNESLAEVEEARKEVMTSFDKLIVAIDGALKNAHKRL